MAAALDPDRLPVRINGKLEGHVQLRRSIVILALAILLAVSGCGPGDNENTISGTWNMILNHVRAAATAAALPESSG